MKKFVIEEAVPQQQTGANIHTFNTSKDGTAQMLMLKTGAPLKPTDGSTFKSFEGEGTRASGRMSIGTARRQKEELMTQDALKKLQKESKSLTKQKSDLVEARKAEISKQASDLLTMTTPCWLASLQK